MGEWTLVRLRWQSWKRPQCVTLCRIKKQTTTHSTQHFRIVLLPLCYTDGFHLRLLLISRVSPPLHMSVSVITCVVWVREREGETGCVCVCGGGVFFLSKQCLSGLIYLIRSTATSRQLFTITTHCWASDWLHLHHSHYYSVRFVRRQLPLPVLWYFILYFFSKTEKLPKGNESGNCVCIF